MRVGRLSVEFEAVDDASQVSLDSTRNIPNC